MSKQQYGHYTIWQSGLVTWRRPCCPLHTPTQPNTVYTKSMSHLQASCDANAQFSCHSSYRVILENNLHMRNIFVTTASLLDTKRARRRQIRTVTILNYSMKLTGFQLVKKFPTFYGTRRFITESQVPATSPYPQPARSSPYSHVPLPDDPS